jgi:hypothetical protein
LVFAFEIARPSMSKVRSLIAGDRSFSATKPASRQAHLRRHLGVSRNGHDCGSEER